MLRHLIRTGVMLPALVSVLTLSGHVTAQTTPAATICKDGTTSTATGRGACSGHGGVQKSSTGSTATGSAGGATSSGSTSTAPAATPPASTAAPTGSATGGTASTTHKSTGSAATQATTSASGAAPAGATAQCKDGSYSKSKHHSGACSHHGGVQQWLDGSSSSQ